MAAIFGQGQNMADTFSPGGQNVDVVSFFYHLYIPSSIRFWNNVPDYVADSISLQIGFTSVNFFFFSFFPPCFSFYSLSISLWVHCFISLAIL